MTSLESWHDFFVAEVGATAALVGLLFVALSINVAQIITFDWLPARGAQTLVVLTGALLVASLELFPGAGTKPLEYVTLAVSLLTWAISTWLVGVYFRTLRRKVDLAQHKTYGTAYAWSAQLAVLPTLVGTALAVAGVDAGLYCIAGGILATLATALFNAWILLIEILR